MTKKKENDERLLPLVVCDERGYFLFLSSTNKKGFSKSLEQGSLWTVHPDTDRLLPDDRQNSLIKIEDREGYYYSEISFAEERAKQAEAPREGEKTAEAEELPKECSLKADPKILSTLADIISRRRKELPEGSYTTHLFKSGLDKIRKKTGEEAVELILARERGEVVYEAADLVYHLFVLLEAEGIGFDPVLRELEKRTK